MIICVTGTPCTGKTEIARKLAEKLNLVYVDVNSLIKENKLNGGYDRKRKCYIVDEKRLAGFLIKEIEKVEKNRTNSKRGCVIDSHLSHHIPSKHVDFCVVTVCNISILKKRLESRGYSKDKVEENLQAEIFRICENEAREIGHRVILCDTTKSFDVKKIIKMLKKENPFTAHL